MPYALCPMPYALCRSRTSYERSKGYISLPADSIFPDLSDYKTKK